MTKVEESLKDTAKAMLDIILNDDSTTMEFIMARSTLFEIIGPNLVYMKRPPFTCVCGAKNNVYTWLEEENCFLFTCNSCGEEFVS